MEISSSKFSLLSNPDEECEEYKSKFTLGQFGKDPKFTENEETLKPLQSLKVQHTSNSIESINEDLQIKYSWDINGTSMQNTDVSSEWDNQDSILLPPDKIEVEKETTCQDETAKEESKEDSAQASPNILNWRVENVRDLAKIDKSDFLGTGITMEEYTKAQGFGNTGKAGYEPALNNILSTVDLKWPVDLKIVALNARNTEYNPKRLAAAVMKIRSPMATALIFPSGKLLWMGARSEEDSKRAAKKFAKTIKNLGFNVSFTDFQIRNIVASADVGFGIKLESFWQNNSSFWQYEPEIFPGWVYKVLKPKVTVLLFTSGKWVLGVPN